MPTAFAVRRNQYFDSVFLMRVAKGLSGEPGVRQAVAVMATEANLRLLTDAGFTLGSVPPCSPSDLLVAVEAETQPQADAAIAEVDDRLHRQQAEAPQSSYRTIEQAHAAMPEANLAVISVPGEFAGREARRSLERGLNVFLFSDNVPIETEVALKQEAQTRGLMVMGPDCGTAIISGIGIGFANAVRRGPIGVIGASGTGTQEITSLVHNAGSGISHAIGTGGRDLSDAVGGTTTLAALTALEHDPTTKVIVLVSKPPGATTLAKIAARLADCPKPVVTCFLGRKAPAATGRRGAAAAGSLEEAADLALRMVGHVEPAASPGMDVEAALARQRAGLGPQQRYVRGLFAGGSFCYQAQALLRDAGLAVRSNAPMEPGLAWQDPLRSVGHMAIDLGADQFTRGRPHPMIDSTVRRQRILAESRDPEVAVILLDIILGYGAASDPAGDLAGAISQARDIAATRGDHLCIVASVCGTDDDPQGLARQTAALTESGAIVLPNSVQAVRFSAALVSGLGNER